MMNLGVGAWRELAERASKERDSKKLMAAIDELCREMDRADRPMGRTCATPVSGEKGTEQP
jgi:enhancing lycopene biosynthesis protein 2